MSEEGWSEKRNIQRRRPKSPELIARMEASAEKYRELTNRLGRAFAGAQEEAYRNWCGWEAERS